MRIWQAAVVCMLVAVLLAAAGGSGFTQESELKVVRDVLATRIENRQPVEAAMPVPSGVGELFYFTEVQGGPGTIQHVWIWQGRTMATVSLEVRSSRFRTWSSKRIMREWTGQWKVEARGPGGAVLSSKEFEVK